MSVRQLLKTQDLEW